MNVKAEDKHITVCFFASLREQIGEESLQMLTDKQTVTELIDQLAERFPILQQWQQKNHLLIAINQQMAKAEDDFQHGDEVAFFPPVTGG